jgi:hypothetical protein
MMHGSMNIKIYIMMHGSMNIKIHISLIIFLSLRALHRSDIQSYFVRGRRDCPIFAV